MTDDCDIDCFFGSILKGRMDYISPDEHLELWSKLIYKDHLGENYLSQNEMNKSVYLEEEIYVSALSNITFWFTIISNFNGDNYISVQAFALELIKKYIHVLYAIDSYYMDDTECAGYRPKSPLSIEDYIEEKFPGASEAITGNIFIRCGDLWYIRFGSSFKMVKNYKGMEVVELLLANVGKSLEFAFIYLTIYPSHLAEEMGDSTSGTYSPGTTEDEKYQYDKIARENVTSDDSMNACDIIPPSKLNRLKISKLNKRIKMYQDQISTETIKNKAEINTKISKLYSEIITLEEDAGGTAAYKKVKDLIQKSVRDTLKYLKIAFPELHDHLKKYLKTSNHYNPKDNAVWHTKYTAKNFRNSIFLKRHTLHNDDG